MWKAPIIEDHSDRTHRWFSFLIVGACLGVLDAAELVLAQDWAGVLACLSTAALMSLGLGAAGSLFWLAAEALARRFPRSSAWLARLTPGIAPLTLALSAVSLSSDPIALLISTLPLLLAVVTGTRPKLESGGFGWWMLLVSFFNLWLWTDLNWIAKLATQSTQLAGLACALTYVACLLTALGCSAVLGPASKRARRAGPDIFACLFGLLGFALLTRVLAQFDSLVQFVALVAWLSLLPLTQRLSYYLETRLTAGPSRTAKFTLTLVATALFANATLKLMRTGTSPISGPKGGRWTSSIYAHLLSPEERLARFRRSLDAEHLTSPFRFRLPHPEPPLPKTPQTIVLLTVDALRGDRVQEIAPPSFLRESWNFTRSYAPSSSTLLSLPALLASQYPSQLAWKLGATDGSHRIYNHSIPSPERVWSWPILAHPPAGMLAVLLSKKGFRTHAILSGGYTHFFDSQAGLENGFHTHVLLGGDEHEGSQVHPNSDERAVQAFDSFLQTSNNKPLFIWLHLFAPHFPYPDDISCNKAIPYDCDVEASARNVSRILNSLKESGRYQDAVIVLSSDHGHSLGDNGVGSRRSGKHAVGVYEAQIRVPLLLRVPGNAGGVTDALASTLDIAPTLLAIVGAEPHPSHVGVDLRSLALGTRRPNPVFFEQWQLKSDGATFTERWVGAVSAETKVFIDERRGRLFEFSLDQDPQEAQNRLQAGAFAPTRVGTQLLRAVLSFRQATADNPQGLPQLLPRP